jgi:transcriptional regulator with XRE-family HTH domain
MQQRMLQNVHCKATPAFVTIRATMMETEKPSVALRREFGKWAKEQREKAGLTQKVVAENTGIHRVHLARIEAGESGVGRNTVIAWTKAVNKNSRQFQVDENEALERSGFAALVPNENEIEAQMAVMAEGILASDGFEQMDEQAREEYFSDLRAIAITMLEERAKRQNMKRR